MYRQHQKNRCYKAEEKECCRSEKEREKECCRSEKEREKESCRSEKSCDNRGHRNREKSIREMFDTDYKDYSSHKNVNFFREAKAERSCCEESEREVLDIPMVHYVVKYEETLQDILEYFGMTFTEFMKCNNTRELSLCPGRRVNVRNHRYMD